MRLHTNTPFNSGMAMPSRVAPLKGRSGRNKEWQHSSAVGCSSRSGPSPSLPSRASRRARFRDLVTLGFRHRRFHDLRATFITLAEDAGAAPQVIESITHTKRSYGSAYRGYSRIQWETKGREVAKLAITRPQPAEADIIPIAAALGGRRGELATRAATVPAIRRDLLDFSTLDCRLSTSIL
jgi:hypothetical protein